MSENTNGLDKIIENVVETVKRAGNIAGQKTTEAVEIGKMKYKEQISARELTKAYTKLGALVYESRVKDEDLEDVIAENIAIITKLNEEVDSYTEAFDEAVEEIKKPVAKAQDPGSVTIEVTEDDDFVEDIIDKADDITEEVGKQVEAVTQKATDKAENITGEINEIIDDFNEKL